MYIIGIDPGYTGAVAVLCVTPRSTALVACLDAPTFTGAKRTDIDGVTIANFLSDIASKDPRLHVFIEAVGPRPHDGPKRAFDFGAGYGCYLGVIAALALRSTRVTPATWKRALKLGADKGLSRGRATQLWPEAKDPLKPTRGLFSRVMDDGRAEAALIAEYGRQLHKLTD